MNVEREDQPVLASFSGFSERLISVETLEPPADARFSSRPTTRIFSVFRRIHKSNRHGELDMAHCGLDMPERRMTINLHSAQERESALYHACVMAVREGFPYLTIGEIIDPPHEMFDAALARQIALHMLIRKFNVPKRRVARMQERSRESVYRALRIIDYRCENPVFLAYYASMAARADATLLSIFEEAA